MVNPLPLLGGDDEADRSGEVAREVALVAAGDPRARAAHAVLPACLTACCRGLLSGACYSGHTTTDGVTHPGTNRLAQTAAGRPLYSPGTPPLRRVSRPHLGASGRRKLLTGKGNRHGTSLAAASGRRTDRSPGTHRHLLS